MSFTIIIPARMKSTRLPEKPLKDILGKPMIVRVAEAATRRPPALRSRPTMRRFLKPAALRASKPFSRRPIIRPARTVSRKPRASSGSAPMKSS